MIVGDETYDPDDFMVKFYVDGNGTITSDNRGALAFFNDSSSKGGPTGLSGWGRSIALGREGYAHAHIGIAGTGSGASSFEHFYIGVDESSVSPWNDGHLVNGCMAGGKNYLHINVNGDVEPCVFVHFAADNIKEKSLAEVVTSPFFMAFRKRQPYTDNHLRPCSIIDCPQVLRDIVAETGAYPTHSGAETIVTTLAKQIDAYSCAYKKIADKAWEEEYTVDEEKQAVG